MSSRDHPTSVLLLSVFIVNCGDVVCPAYLSRESRLATYPRLSRLKPIRPGAGLSKPSKILSLGPFTQFSFSAGFGPRPRVRSATSTVPASKLSFVPSNLVAESRKRHCWNHRYTGRRAGSATGCIVRELTVVSCGSIENHDLRPEVALAGTCGNASGDRRGARSHVDPASNLLAGAPFSESTSTRTGPVPFGQVIGASGGCLARGGVVRSRVARVARWTLRQSALVIPTWWWRARA